jgi:hypothetical protein
LQPRCDFFEFRQPRQQADADDYFCFIEQGDVIGAAQDAAKTVQYMQFLIIGPCSSRPGAPAFSRTGDSSIGKFFWTQCMGSIAAMR